MPRMNESELKKFEVNIIANQKLEVKGKLYELSSTQLRR